MPKEGHLGQFPANFCVKLIGVSGEWTGDLGNLIINLNLGRDKKKE